MHWLYVIIIGFLIGLVARFLTPGRDALGFILTTAVGIGGALIASWVGEQLHVYPSTGLGHFVAAVIGAVVLLLILRAVRR